MDGTVLLRDGETPSRELSYAPDGLQVLTHDDILANPHRFEPFDICFADPPGSDDLGGRNSYEMFMSQFFESLQYAMSANSALIIAPREQKGSGFFKTAIIAYMAERYGWTAVREYLCLYTDGDFHRSNNAFSHVLVYRRGHKPMQGNAFLRYKDIIRFPMPKSHASGDPQSEIDPSIPRMFIQLFYRAGTPRLQRVLDPFAGGAAVARACYQLGLQSVSYELMRSQYEFLRDQIWPTFRGDE